MRKADQNASTQDVKIALLSEAPMDGTPIVPMPVVSRSSKAQAIRTALVEYENDKPWRPNDYLRHPPYLMKTEDENEIAAWVWTYATVLVLFLAAIGFWILLRA